MLGDRISISNELNNTDHTTGKNNYNAISNNGSPVFKTVGNSKKGLPEKTLSDRESIIEKLIENNLVIALTKKFNPHRDEGEQKLHMNNYEPDIHFYLDSEEYIGKGVSGIVYGMENATTDNATIDKAYQDEKENNIKYVMKVYTGVDSQSNALSDFEKSKSLIKEMVNFTKKTCVCATLQTLELMVPFIEISGVNILNEESQGYAYGLLMMKVDGQNGNKSILGYKVKNPDGSEKYIKPIDGYNVELIIDDTEYYCVEDPKISLDIACQKIFTLRGLHDLGFVYGDVKIGNVVIQKENDKYTVRLIDLGSITEKDKKDGFVYTPLTSAPEKFVGGKTNKKYTPNPKFDIFANAVDMPYIFFGEVAKKHLQKLYKLKESSSLKIVASFNRIKNKAFHFEKWGWLKTLFMFIFKKKEYEEYKNLNQIFAERGEFEDRLFLNDIFSAYEYADNDDVEETLKEYGDSKFKNPNFSPPNFPENMTNAQKMRYMYWHLGFLKTNRDIESGTGENGEKGKGVYLFFFQHQQLILLQ